MVSFFVRIFAPNHSMAVLIPPAQFALILDRLAHQLIEHHDFSMTDLVDCSHVARDWPNASSDAWKSSPVEQK